MVLHIPDNRAHADCSLSGHDPSLVLLKAHTGGILIFANRRLVTIFKMRQRAHGVRLLQRILSRSQTCDRPSGGLHLLRACGDRAYIGVCVRYARLPGRSTPDVGAYACSTPVWRTLRSTEPSLAYARVVRLRAKRAPGARLRDIDSMGRTPGVRQHMNAGSTYG